jgi:ABC-type branched-subunit amino acid transport system substrate-binding protein
VVAREFYPTDLKDFSPLITRVLRQTPDAIDFGPGARGPLFVAAIKTVREQGFKGPTFAQSATVGDLRDAGAVAEGFFFPIVADYKSPLVGDMFTRIAQRAIDKYGEAQFDPGPVLMYGVPGVLKQAMDKAGTIDDTAKLAQTLRDGEWDTIFGKARFVGARTFGLASVLQQPVFLSKVQDGKVITHAVIKPELP